MAAGATALLTDVDRDAVKGILIEFKNQYTQVKTDIEKLGKADSSTLEKLDKLDTAMIEMRGKYEDASTKASSLEERIQKLLAQPQAPKTIGELLIADESFVAHAKSGSRAGWSKMFKQSIYAGMGMKDITGLGALLPAIQPSIASLPRLMTGVRKLIPQGTTTAGAVQYARELTFTNNANVVAEGAAKPKSDKTFEAVTEAVTTIAHYFKVSKQSYEDLPGLSAQIEANGIYGVQFKEDQQLLYGTGVSPQLEGFMTVAAAAAAAGGTGATLVDAIGAAIFQLAGTGYLADGTVVNPVDWGAVAMLKNSQGNYLFANPMEYGANLNIWGTRLVLSANMVATNFLVGAFKGNSLLLDREEVSVQVATQNEDDFIKNMLTILIEERLVNLIFRAAAFLKGTTPAEGFTAASQNTPAGESRRR